MDKLLQSIATSGIVVLVVCSGRYECVETDVLQDEVPRRSYSVKLPELLHGMRRTRKTLESTSLLWRMHSRQGLLNYRHSRWTLRRALDSSAKWNRRACPGIRTDKISMSWQSGHDRENFSDNNDSVVRSTCQFNPSCMYSLLPCLLFCSAG